MRLILVDPPQPSRVNFYPLALSHPVWELRCGFTSLAEKLTAAVGAADVAGFVPDYMADAVRARTSFPVNDPSALAGDDLLIVDPRVKAESLGVSAGGASEVGVDGNGGVLYARITADDAAKLPAGGIGELLAAGRAKLPNVRAATPTWRYVWDLMLANSEQIASDFAAAGRSGIEGTIEQPNAIRGSPKDVYVGPGVTVHPMVVIDATEGPVYLDAGVEVHPFTRIEGPCYIGRRSVLLGAKVREGCSVGPVCRIGGELEESVILGHSNKYHDGFLGHAYVGEWVNLGALTTNSDLKNDYSTVSVTVEGQPPIDTGSMKVGALIGDHTKTSIGTLLNTGAYLGAMAMVVATGKPLPKCIPSFSWLLDGVVTKGFGRRQLYETAEAVMARRDRRWTPAEQAMWDAVFEMTAPQRDRMIERGRRRTAGSGQRPRTA